MPEPESTQAAIDRRALEYAVASVTMTGRRRTNEDTCLVATFTSKAHGRVAVLAVADGMGGLPGGAVASEFAIQRLREHLLEFQSGKRKNVREMLASAFRASHESVKAHGSGNAAARNLGTTLTAALVSDGGAVVAHVGDTRVYVIQEGLIRQVTHDHNIIQDMLDRELYTWDHICRNANVRVNALTRCIGHEDSVVTDFVPVEPELRIELEPGMFLFACSDGLTGLVDGEGGLAKPAVSDDEILAKLTESEDLQEACKALVTLAYQRGSRDNITVGALRVCGPGQAPKSASDQGLRRPQSPAVLPFSARRALAATRRGVRRAFDFQSAATLIGWVGVALAACIALATVQWGDRVLQAIRSNDGDGAIATAPPAGVTSHSAGSPSIEFSAEPGQLTRLSDLHFRVQDAAGEPADIAQVSVSFFGHSIAVPRDSDTHPASKLRLLGDPKKGDYFVAVQALLHEIHTRDQAAQAKSNAIEITCSVGGRPISTGRVTATTGKDFWRTPETSPPPEELPSPEEEPERDDPR